MLSAAFVGAASLTCPSAVKVGRYFAMPLGAATPALPRQSSIGSSIGCSIGSVGRGLHVSNAKQQIRRSICGICIAAVRRGDAVAIAHGSPANARCSSPVSISSVDVTTGFSEAAAASPLQSARVRAPRPLVVTGNRAVAVVAAMTIISATRARSLPIPVASVITVVTLRSTTRVTRRLVAVLETFSARTVTILGLNSRIEAPVCTVTVASACAPAEAAVAAAGRHAVVRSQPARINSPRAPCAAVARGVATLQLRPGRRLSRSPRRAPARHGSGLARDGLR